VSNLKANELAEFCGQLTAGCGTDGITNVDCECRTVFCPSDPLPTNGGHENKRDETVLYHISEDHLQLDDDWVRTGPAEN
jgi:hypothetical protein